MPDDTTLTITGEGSHKKKLQKLIEELGAEKKVEVKGFYPQKELWQAYANADVFVSLSQREGYGTSVAEALVAGIPRIVPNTSPLKQWVDGQNCFGIECPINIQRLADLITRTVGKQAHVSEGKRYGIGRM